MNGITSPAVGKITRRAALSVGPLALLPVASAGEPDAADTGVLVSQAIMAVKAYHAARRNLRDVRRRLAGAGPAGDTQLEMAESLAGIAASNAEGVLVAAILAVRGHVETVDELEGNFGAFMGPLRGSWDDWALDHDGRRYELVGLPLRVNVVRLDDGEADAA
jgi:hypothetical protein